MGYTIAQAKTFIEQIAPLMQKEAKKRGYIIVSTAISQSVVESAAGTSSLGYRYHNYFGLKCGSSWKGESVNLKTKEEYKVGTLTTIRDNFRVYPNMEEGVKGYYDFISTKRYANLKTANTPRQYAEYLKADGYATSSTYVNTLVSTVTKYGLDKYDREEIDDVKDIAIAHPTLRLGDSNEYVKAWQIYLNRHGYDVGKAGCDGKFGKDTWKAVYKYQKDHPECGTPDGVIGPKTWASIL